MENFRLNTYANLLKKLKALLLPFN